MKTSPTSDQPAPPSNDGGSKPRLQIPKIEAPKGGGAIRSLGENFEVDPSTGTASLRVPIPLPSTAREMPLDLSLSYDSGRGNGPFGLGWQLDLPSISRKTDRGIPRYGDDDVFLLSGAEELVPRVRQGSVDCVQVGDFDVCRFRPRVESASDRIERWTERGTGLSHWRVTNSQNVTSVFGQDDEARITDPDHPDRIFSWLLQEVRTDRGEIIRFSYKQEDSSGLSPGDISETHRLRRVGTASLLRANAQRYIKRIQFGNSEPFSATAFHFEFVFDYGEHEDTPDEARPWSLRPDPFSAYRSSFEIRTYRRCGRILLFHHFAELGASPVLTRVHELTYDEDRHISKLRSVVQRGYRTDTATGVVESESHPALEFDYTPLEFDTQVRYLDRQSLLGIPAGVEGKQNQWVDLDGEGIPGVLTAHRDSWSYKANLGGGRFAEPQPLVTLPSPRNLGRGPQALQDLDGNGQLALVQYEPPIQGFFPRTASEDWGPFQAFPAVPRLNWDSPHLRFVDVDGDGLTDVLMSSDRGFDWIRGKGKDGFEPGGFTPYPNSEAEGPQVVFADASHSIHLADMSGDGLQDIVRVSNGEVCYWPNLGYGRFGAKVTMERSPTFASLRDFDPRRVRLSDIDGSGTADIIYLGKTITLYLNEAGNGWSTGMPIPGLGTKDALSEVSVVDLLGTGTSCLVHSSFSPADRLHPVSYIDLLGSKKPHLLQGIRNNLGGETCLEYAPSTKFYLEDAAAGRPWLTRLHFPVQVVERTEHHDHVTGAKLVTRYRYRHGYYDGPEREFRGFALVDKWDAESFREGPGASALDLPPVRTRTWFHTGASLHGAPLEEELAAEFHGGQTAPPLRNVLPPTNSLEEAREAARALRGKVLREEVFAEDGSAKEGEPYLVTEHRYQVKQLQEKGGRRHGVFFPHLLDTLETHTERDPGNPRKRQQLFLEVDKFGNVLLEAEVAFQRSGGSDATQGQTLTRVTKRKFANSPANAGWYRHSVPLRETAFQLMKWDPTEPRVDPEEFADYIQSLNEVPFHDDDPSRPPRLREIEASLILYTDDQQGGPLPEGEIESLALPYDTYRKAFTPELVERTFRDRVDAGILVAEGGYTDPLGDGDYWAPTGRIVFDATKFYLPQQFIDPFSAATEVRYDASGLLLVETTDPVGNVTAVDNDYRALQPTRIVDPNENETLLAYDPLGLLVQLARRGKGEGDDLSDPTLSFHYDLHAWSRDGTPAWSRTESKEAYGPGNTRHQIAWTYTSGLGEEVMQKVQAQPGEALLRGPDGRLVLGHVQERWIGTGRTVLDNKGNVVKQYEPYFSSTPAYEDEEDLVEWGVTPIFHYDPLRRLIRTEMPNGTERRVEFDAWSQTEWDENDAIEGTDWLHERLLLDPTDPEYRAAMLALEHANTPTVTHFDPLGRPYLQVEDNGPAGLHETRSELDLQGNPRRVIDARGVVAADQTFDMLGRPLYLLSPDSSETWTLADYADAPIRRWDGRGFAVRWFYDLAQRQTHVYAQEPGQSWTLVEYALYGEHHP